MASTLEDRLRPDSVPIVYTFKKFKWDQFFVGLFGALAIFGVLMKLWDPSPFWGLVSDETGELLFQIFMPIGFLGECIVFIIMGFIKGDGYVEVYPDQEVKEELMKSEPGAGGGVTVNMQLPDSLKSLIEKKLSEQIDTKIADLTNTLTTDFEKTKKLLTETNEAYSGLNTMGKSLTEFSKRIEDIDKRLKGFENLDPGSLSASANNMSKRLDEAGKGISNFEGELTRVAEKFKRFNN